MNNFLNSLRMVFSSDAAADRVVPPTGFTVRLTLFAAGAMAFLTIFALAMSLASGRLAKNWGEDLARAATIRISAPADQIDAHVAATQRILEQTPGIASHRVLSDAEQQKLLEPWFGPGLPVESLPIPRLIDVVQERRGYDADGLRLRLQAEVPSAVLDDHRRWQAPLVQAAGRLKLLGWTILFLIAGATGAMVTLAANAALAANAQLIAVLRLVGATDSYIASAFIRRFTLRSFVGAAVGTGLGLVALLLMPGAGDTGGFLTGLRFVGWHWFLPLLVPLLAAVVGFFATDAAARRVLGALS